MAKEEPLVSVIIPTYNSERTIEKCLESIKKQTYKNIEIIIVDKGSKDKTVEIAKKYTDKVFVINAKERTEQKNFGLKVANGKYVLFIDSDMYLETNVIRECVEICENDVKVGGVCIPVKDIGKSFWVNVIAFERELYKGSGIMEAARFLRKDLVEKVGGFEEDIIFLEEFTVPQKIEKLGYNVRSRCNSYIIHDFYDFSLIKYLKKKFYYGKTAWKYLEKYKDYGLKQINPLGRFKIFFTRKEFYMRPHLAIGLIILKMLEYVSAGFGYIIGKLEKNQDLGKRL